MNPGALGLQILAVAIVLALAVAAVLKLFDRVMARLAPGATARFKGPPAGADQSRGRSLYAILAICSILIVAWYATVCANELVVSSARVMGFFFASWYGEISNGEILFWTAVVVVLFVELGHLMRLDSIWSRFRFVVLLIGLPLALYAASRFALIKFGAYLPADWQGATTIDWLALVSFGIVPLTMPAIHASLFAPFATRLGGMFGEDYREGVAGVGNVLLVALAFGALVWTVQLPRPPISQAQADWSKKPNGPVPSGTPHNCSGYYPLESMRLGEQGDVIVSFQILATGQVSDAKIDKSSGFRRLDDASLLCVSHWTYTPAQSHGQPIAVPWKARVIWSLRSSP